MAEYGIVMGIDTIKGNCALSDYKDHLLVDSVSFNSAASRTSSGGGLKGTSTSVDQSPIEITVTAGKWTAELLQALYSVTDLGDVKIFQLGQAIDKTSTAAPTVIQKLTLSNAVLANVGQHWSASDGPRMLTLTLEFDKILFEIGTVPADFTLRNITAGAK